MSFRKRNIGISHTDLSGPAIEEKSGLSLRGVKPSPITGTPTTSTGTLSLDKLLNLGAGLALGTSLLIEEDGTTDFSSALLRCYAAEGLLQGHAVFVVAPDGSMVLPGVVGDARGKSKDSHDQERMKIAWRYERLSRGGEDGRGPSQRHSPFSSVEHSSKLPASKTFCHTFDLTKRLELPNLSQPIVYLVPTTNPTTSPFLSILQRLTIHLSNATQPTRLVIPTLLSPLLYPSHASQPHYLLSFIAALRALLHTHTTLTILASYPLSLYPRHISLTRWTEHLFDGVIQLQPFPHAFSIDVTQSSGPSTSATGKDDEKMQGLLKVLKVPVLSERGVGVGGGEDMAFAVGRKKFVIRPFHLPPMDGEEERTNSKSEEKALEF